MSIKDGGPAFPIPSEEMRLHGQSVGEAQGMSLRDYFAAKAMEGILNNNKLLNEITLLGKDKGTDSISKQAYAVADAMLHAREAK